MQIKVAHVDQKIKAYLEAIDANPDQSGPYAMLGHTLQEAGRLEESLVAYREGLEVDRANLEIHASMISVLARLRRFDEARAQQARAAAINANSALVRHALGEINLNEWNLNAAAECFREAVVIDPNLFPSWNFLGATLSSLGRFDEAAKCFKQLLLLKPDSAMGYSNLVGTGRCGDVPALERLTGLLNDTSLPIDERIPACFALGKLLDDAERYDEAFARYAEANSLMKARQTASGWRLDPQAFRKQVEEMISVFTPEFFAERRGWGDASQLPVFVVGMPRSGTTLVQQIMASHPSVHGAGELSDLLAIARNLGGDDIRGAATGWQRQALGEAANCHLAHLQAMKPTATRIIDKMPSNVHRVGLIALLFPSARVIQCRRDARDTCLSCYFQLFSAGHEFSYDLADCAQEWLATERLMDHWRKISPLRILDVQYEALVEDLEAQSRRLIDFVDLPWDPACLQFHRTQSAVLTSSVWQVRQPIYHRSIGRWKHYEKHLGPLNKTLAAM